MTTGEKLQLLREKMKERSLDAYYIPTADPHMSEYLPEQYKTRRFMSGFTGSAGTLLVLPDEAFLWTDGRYFIQAEKELAGSTITLCKMGMPQVPTVVEFFEKRFAKGGRLGVDGKILSAAWFKVFKEKVPKLEFVTDIDLVGEIWTDRPAPVASKAFTLDTKYCGETAESKINRLRKLLAEKEVNTTIISALDEVCYLFNIRASDVHCNPVLTSYALIDGERACLFVNQKQIPAGVRKDLEKQGVSIFDYEEIFSEAEKIVGSVYLDPNTTNLYLFKKLKVKVIEGDGLVIGMKACKNEIEIKNIRNTMITDGVALTKFLYWLSKNAASGISEIDTVKKLRAFRKQGEGFIDDSFDTIAGYAENGAIVHYAPVEGADKKLAPKSFLLLDSGGHYYSGTTDITRTIPLGDLTEDECRDYTLVLKSHINLARAKFKKGTTGFALDTLARVPFWAEGKDYNHGTGHGVGFVLAVHEGPQSISQRYIKAPLEAGMLTSNEPGLYIEGKYGIRIESLVLTKELTKTEFGTFYEFETLTLCPINTKPVVKEMLSVEELAWLNAYNAQCYDALAPHLSDEEKKFLENECKGI